MGATQAAAARASLFAVILSSLSLRSLTNDGVHDVVNMQVTSSTPATAPAQPLKGWSQVVKGSSTQDSSKAATAAASKPNAAANKVEAQSATNTHKANAKSEGSSSHHSKQPRDHRDRRGEKKDGSGASKQAEAAHNNHTSAPVDSVSANAAAAEGADAAKARTESTAVTPAADNPPRVRLIRCNRLGCASSWIALIKSTCTCAAVSLAAGSLPPPPPSLPALPLPCITVSHVAVPSRRWKPLNQPSQPGKRYYYTLVLLFVTQFSAHWSQACQAILCSSPTGLLCGRPEPILRAVTSQPSFIVLLCPATLMLPDCCSPPRSPAGRHPCVHTRGSGHSRLALPN